MTPSETNEVIRTLVAYFGELPRQPKWDDPLVLGVWREMLAPFSLADAVVAVNDLRERIAKRLDEGASAYFPIVDEFGNFLRRSATEAEREAYQRDALTSAIRCDASRWIDNAPNAVGVRPFPMKGDGLVACPTCSPSMQKRQMQGNQHEPIPRGEQASPAACRVDHEDFDGPSIIGRDEIGRAKAMLAAGGQERPGRPRAFRSTRDLDQPEADTAAQPTDRELACPWCVAHVMRTRMLGWWRCENGHTSTMSQILAGPGGGRWAA